MNRYNFNAEPAPPRKTPLDVLFFSWANNVWFGISVLTAIFIYSSLGSAIPPLRQHPWFDMTEMEWFHWWPFDLLIALMCVNLVTVTIKQIPLRLVNAGVWAIHTGVVVLCIGSVYYFSTKLEGDAPIYRRQAVIRVPGQAEPVSLLVRPENHVTVGQGRQQYHFTVSNIFPDWTIASGEDQGKQAMMVWVGCVTPTERFTRQLLVGYPQYTEDILADGTRAKKRPSGDPLVDKSIEMKLDYVPQTEFFLQDTAALYTRLAGADRWVERPMADLPRYHDRIADYDEISPRGDRSMPLRPLELVVPEAVEPGDPLAGYDVRVTGYLRYAFKSASWRGGGDRLNPVAGLTLTAGPDARLDYDLIAFHPQRNASENGQLVFRWVESPDALERLLNANEGRLIFRAPGRDGEVVVALDDVADRGAEAPFIPIEGTDLAFRVKNVLHNLVMQSGDRVGHSMSVVTLEIQTPDRTFTRFVADVPGASRDVGEDGAMRQPDPVVSAAFDPGGVQSRVTLVSGPAPVGTFVLFKETNGQVTQVPISPGKPIDVTDEVQLTLRYLFSNGVEETRPRVVPLEQRERGAGETFSLVKLELAKDDWHHTEWLEFNSYALPDEQYAISRRITYSPARVRLPDGRLVELLYSRDREPLPAPIALETFELATHTGGYTGATITVRDFISQLRFGTDNGWSDQMQMSSNTPASHGGFWFFQSTWDPPAQGYAGMNFTGVGVGNRNGVHVQLAGTCIAVAGMIFAFYVKPIIRRRMQARSRGAVPSTTVGQTDRSETDAVQTLAGVAAAETAGGTVGAGRFAK